MRVKVTARMCYLCYEDGEDNVASHTYQTSTGDEYDICGKHNHYIADNLPELDVWEITDPYKESMR